MDLSMSVNDYKLGSKLYIFYIVRLTCDPIDDLNRQTITES